MVTRQNFSDYRRMFNVITVGKCQVIFCSLKLRREWICENRIHFEMVSYQLVLIFAIMWNTNLINVVKFT
jgi:hypothetical protein